MDAPRSDVLGAQRQAGAWLSSRGHRGWLLAEANRLLGFYQYAAVDPAGGFFELDADGRPSAEPTRHLVWTSRMVYCFSLAHLLGRPGASVIADHGLRSLIDARRDERYGGYVWIVGPNGPVDPSKQAYGYAHVLLAAAAASLAERAGAEELFEDVFRAIDERFWSARDGLVVEEYDRDWSGPSPYRGANSNMHLVEGLLGASDATGDPSYAHRARRIAEALIRERTASNDWRVAEHWMLDAAVRLFRKGVEEGWDGRIGGLLYTVDFDGRPLNRDRYWWPVAEAISAAAYLCDATGEAFYERWYRTFWDFADTHLIDHERGGWRHVLDPENRPKLFPYAGKVDLFHALHACLLPLLPKDEGPALALARGRLEP